jgi:hypothetical protein
MGGGVLDREEVKGSMQFSCNPLYLSPQSLEASDVWLHVDIIKNCISETRPWVTLVFNLARIDLLLDLSLPVMSWSPCTL